MRGIRVGARVEEGLVEGNVCVRTAVGPPSEAAAPAPAGPSDARQAEKLHPQADTVETRAALCTGVFL